MSNATFYKINEPGELATMNEQSGWRNTWDIIVPGHFSSQFYTDLLFYEASSGDAKFFTTDGSGNLKPMSTQKWQNRWDIIVPGKFGGDDTFTDLLFFDRTNGAVKFCQTDGEGNLINLNTDNWKSRWDLIIPGNFGGNDGFTDLLLYDRSTGEAKFYKTDGAGHVDILDAHDWKNKWDIIVPGNFGGGSGFTDLLFYDRETGEAKFYSTDGHGKINVIKPHDWKSKWDIILPGQFGANDSTGLLFYDRETGDVKIYTTHGAGEMSPLINKPGLLKNADKVVVGKFDKAAPVHDLLFYGQQNKAIHLAWGGCIDTNVKFSDFLDADHTIMAWFMPQYLHAYEGPIFGENGTGFYAVGQGNHDDGNKWDPDGTDPVFFIKIGNQKALYLLPDLRTDRWQHIAVVRASNTIKLYVNGVHQDPVVVNGSAQTVTPAAEIVLSASFASKPSGTLRFGRRTDGDALENNYQAYGLLDDVVIFKSALDATKINEAMNRRRLSGSEKSLALWTFDVQVPWLSPPSASWWRSTKGAGGDILAPAVAVSSSRDGAADGKLFHETAFIARNQVGLPLPFAVGEEWHVVQGNNSAAGGSHKGTTAFAYDLKRAEGTVANAPIFCSRTGKAVFYIKDGGLNAQVQERNHVYVKSDDGPLALYHHLAANSLPAAVTGGVPDPDGVANAFVIDEANAPVIEAGSQIGKVGPNALHVHTQLANNFTQQKVTVPLAYVNFEESSDQGVTWRKVERGHLKSKWRIRRMS